MNFPCHIFRFLRYQYKKYNDQIFIIHSSLVTLRAVVIALGIVCPSISEAIITVEISPEFSSIFTTNSSELKVGANDGSILPDTPLKDGYLIDLTVTGGKARAVVIDKHDEETENLNPKLIINREVEGRTFIETPYIPSGSGGIFFVINEQHQSIKVEWTIYRIGIRPPSATKPIKETIEAVTQTINNVYKTPDMKLLVEPCGQSNAYAGNAIIICSELVSELSDKEKAIAIHAVIAHELAHVLLKYWNLPGYDNEDLADEFTIALLGKSKKKDSIISFIGWLESKNSIQEAIYQITLGDKHSISIQRARNLKNGLERINEITDRWLNMTQPYFIFNNKSAK